MSKHTSLVKQVASYRSLDGTLHTSRLTALMENQKIEVRGIIQSGYNGMPIKNCTLTVTDAVNIALQNVDKLATVIRKYNQAIKRERENGQRRIQKCLTVQ